MNKLKTTRKQIVQNSAIIFNAGYCSLQALLSYNEPVAYTAGIYGWNFDVYDINGVTICTGYRNMPGMHCVHAYTYETRAAAIKNDLNLTYEEQKEAVNALLYEFIERNIRRYKAVCEL